MLLGEKSEPIFGVLEFIEALNISFKQREVSIVGEVCQTKIAASGHVYFTLKDKEGTGVLDCIVWKRNYALYGIDLEVGMEVVVTGHPEVYAALGKFSIVCSALELVGEGALQKAYNALKEKLEKEGLFEPSRKRVLPEFVHTIGVITSKQGAVIHDFRNNLGKFGYEVRFIDSRVEGQLALKDLRAAVKAMRKEKIEVLVVIRGGGSLESLQAFNNEALIRDLVNFPVPVIAGIGHDQDIPLLALAADYMTSTPTAAAHLINRSWEEAYAKVRQLAYLPGRILQQIARMKTDLDTAWSTMIDHTADRIAQIKEHLAYAGQTIKLNDPTRQLKLGYSIVRQNGKIVKSIREASVGQQVDIQVTDGTLESRIETVN